MFVFEIPENDTVLCGDLSDFALMTQNYIYKTHSCCGM